MPCFMFATLFLIGFYTITKTVCRGTHNQFYKPIENRIVSNYLFLRKHFLKKILFYLFLERGGGIEAPIGCLSHIPNWGPGPQPRQCWESSQQPFSLQVSTKSTEPHQPRLSGNFSDILQSDHLITA